MRKINFTLLLLLGAIFVGSYLYSSPAPFINVGSFITKSVKILIGRLIVTNPTVSDHYQVGPLLNSMKITTGRLSVYSYASSGNVTGVMEQCDANGTICSNISSNLAVSSNAAGNFTWSNSNATYTEGNTVYFNPLTVGGNVTSFTVHAGGTIP